MTADARTTDPSTSHQAAAVAEASVAASQTAVRRVLETTRISLTDEDIAEYIWDTGLSFSASRLRTARHELVNQGVVVAAGTVKPEGRRTRLTLWTLA